MVALRNGVPPEHIDEDIISPAQPTNPPAHTPKPPPPTWPPLSKTHPLRQLQERLPAILAEASYSEIYGVTLSATPATTKSADAAAAADGAAATADGGDDDDDKPLTPFTTTLILQKFLRANANNVDKAAEQLTATLKWRREFQPLKAADERFDEERFGGLGYITVVDAPETEKAAAGSGGGEGALKGKMVITWNIYGAVTDFKKTFGDLDGFLRWRVALMERSIRHLHLPTAQHPIPDHGSDPAAAAAAATGATDPYQTIQVHDYLSVRFLRMDAAARAASQRAIALFQAHYPEMLARKLFVNVPLVMGWMFAAMRPFMARETVRKLTMLSYGAQLAGELGTTVAVPRAYGGQGGELKDVGETVEYVKEKEIVGEKM